MCNANLQENSKFHLNLTFFQLIRIAQSSSIYAYDESITKYKKKALNEIDLHGES